MFLKFTFNLLIVLMKIEIPHYFVYRQYQSTPCNNAFTVKVDLKNALINDN